MCFHYFLNLIIAILQLTLMCKYQYYAVLLFVNNYTLGALKAIKIYIFKK